MATSQRCSPPRSRSAFLKEGFLLPARNLGLFIPNFLLVIAYTTVSVLAYSASIQPLLTDIFHNAEYLWSTNETRAWHAEIVRETRTRAGQLIVTGGAYLLFTVLTVGPAVSAVTVSSAVTTCCGERRTSFRKLLGKVFEDGLKGPFATAAYCNVLHICACRGAITSLGFCFAFHQKYTSDLLLYVEPFLFFLAELFALYIDVVGTVRVAVSVAEPGGCFHGARVLRHGRWLAAEKTTQPVLLIVVKGAVMVAMSLLTFMCPIARFYHRVAFDVLLGFIYAILYGAVQLWFVCATTAYYYQCRQSECC